MTNYDIATNISNSGDLVFFNDNGKGHETKAYNLLKIQKGDYIYDENVGLENIFDLQVRYGVGADTIEAYVTNYLFSNEVHPTKITSTKTEKGELSLTYEIKGTNIFKREVIL